MQKLIIALGMALLFTTASAFAETAKLPEASEKLDSQGQLALRAASPDAAFGTKGEKIGWVKQGETVKVVSLKQVSTVFGFEVWIEVQAADGKQGWIYDGMTSEVLRGNANLARHEAAEAAGTMLAKAN
jgi:hypothetical protein